MAGAQATVLDHEDSTKTLGAKSIKQVIGTMCSQSFQT